MSSGIRKTGVEILARAYYGLDLVGNATHRMKISRGVSITCCIRNGLITADHQITEQGVHVLMREASKPRG
jgi:hypothetical protein